MKNILALLITIVASEAAYSMEEALLKKGKVPKGYSAPLPLV